MVSKNFRNILSVSWGDHLLFGEGDGRLTTPKALKRRMKRWCKELGACSIHWRQNRTMLSGHLFAEPSHLHPLEKLPEIKWDDFEVVPTLAHQQGLKANLYVSLFDEGWPLLPKKLRQVSYHNTMHGQHVSWQSKFSLEHPEYTVVDRSGNKRQWGILCLAYPEVRTHFCNLFTKLLDGYEFDGLFICFRSQSRPSDFADQYNFNEPVRQDFLNRYGKDILTDNFDLKAWRDLLGEYITRFLTELRQKLRRTSTNLSVGIPRGDVLGPPMGNVTLQWREWIKQNLVDELIINQNSSKCPSLWIQLWPMHRGCGYIQNYLGGYNLLPLQEHLTTYFPYFHDKSVKLFVARQWDERSLQQEAKLLENPAVSGLVFSSFRFDNPGPISRENWIA